LVTQQDKQQLAVALALADEAGNKFVAVRANIIEELASELTLGDTDVDRAIRNTVASLGGSKQLCRPHVNIVRRLLGVQPALPAPVQPPVDDSPVDDEDELDDE
jgi:hypothetical protein